MIKSLKTFAVLLILLCSISGSAFAKGDMSDNARLDPGADGFTNLINSKIQLLENEIENSDDPLFVEEAEVLIVELENVRYEIQESSNEEEFASSLNKFNSLMENSSEDFEQIFMGNQETSVDRIDDLRNKSTQMNDVRNKSAQMNNASGDMKPSILSDEREDIIKDVSSRSSIVDGNEASSSSSNSNFLSKFVNKIMSLF